MRWITSGAIRKLRGCSEGICSELYYKMRKNPLIGYGINLAQANIMVMDPVAGSRSGASSVAELAKAEERLAGWLVSFFLAMRAMTPPLASGLSPLGGPAEDYRTVETVS